MGVFAAGVAIYFMEAHKFIKKAWHRMGLNVRSSLLAACCCAMAQLPACLIRLSNIAGCLVHSSTALH